MNVRRMVFSLSFGICLLSGCIPSEDEPRLPTEPEPTDSIGDETKALRTSLPPQLVMSD